MNRKEVVFIYGSRFEFEACLQPPSEEARRMIQKWLHHSKSTSDLNPNEGDLAQQQSGTKDTAQLKLSLEKSPPVEVKLDFGAQKSALNLCV